MDNDNFHAYMEAGTWQELIPFESYDLPAFPVEALPGPVEAFVEALAESTQTPLEMGGLLALGVMASAIQKRFTVRVKSDWQETLNLFTVIVGAPAERKSPVLNRVTKPLRVYEQERRKADAAYIAQSETELKILEGRKNAAESAAMKGKDNAHEEALSLAVELAEFQPVRELRLLVDDATPEKLAELMEAQGGSITLCSAEGGLFDMLSGRRYDNVNLDVYLKSWDGEPLVVDRIGRKSNRVDNPRLTTLLAIQPEVLSGVMSNSAFRGRGLCGRFLYALCRGKIGKRRADPEPVPASVESSYFDFILRLLTGEEAGELHLSPEASECRSGFQDNIESLLVGRWEDIQEWAGKLTGTVCRIAGILHVGTSLNPLDEPISEETFIAACKLGLFLGYHAEAAFGLMGSNKTEQDAMYISKRIMGSECLTRADLTRRCRGHFKKAGDMDMALAALEERHYIRIEDEPIDYNGRTRKVYYVNPALR